MAFISSKARHRELTGRWPVGTEQTPERRRGPAPPPRRRVRKGERSSPNTRRAKRGGTAEATRGRKGVIDRAE